jgi:hypothetical protein
MNHMTADLFRAIDSMRWTYRMNRAKIKALGLVLFATTLVVVDYTNPVEPSPFNDGMYCTYTVSGYRMCKKPGDYNPRYYITPDGRKLLARW